uniref:syntaxin-binding protein 5-like isoform X2 n=1 Tax=Myxine glutinosa TaxID=7769 RepID=UPI00358E8F4E
MRRFTDNVRKVLDGLGAEKASTTPTRSDVCASEPLFSDHFNVCKTVRHGFPYQPSALALDPVQRLLAIGTRLGALRIFGRPGVDCHCHHEAGCEVTHLQFLVNEGALVSACADDMLHMWNLRQKRPAILHALKFNKERVSYIHLPFQSRWLYLGTRKGNIHVVNIETFLLSGYVIMWNRAIEISAKAHPGAVVHISENPTDENKLLIGYERGPVVLWDLKSKKADFRYYYEENTFSVAWQQDGKQFLCGHADGSLTTWSVKNSARPTLVTTPHKKAMKDGKKCEACGPIIKVEHKSCRAGDPFTIFWGGVGGTASCVSVIRGRSLVVLEMESPIVDFLTLCESPYPADFQDPYAIVVLLERDLVIVDLTENGYPVFENPYPMDLHESPVTCCSYAGDCPDHVIPALYAAGSRARKHHHSTQDWPISGGTWDIGTCSVPELIITGHADGSLKFWDASAITMQLLCKLKSWKLFEPGGGGRGADQVGDEDPFAVQLVSWSREGRVLSVAGATHVLAYGFHKQETTGEVAVLEVRFLEEGEPCNESPENESAAPTTPHGISEGQTSEGGPQLRARVDPLRQGPGFQGELVVLLAWAEGEPAPQITCLEASVTLGMIAIGTCGGLAVVDVQQKALVMALTSADLYCPLDACPRQPRSPRRSKPSPGSLSEIMEASGGPEGDSRSPSSDQLDGMCLNQPAPSRSTSKRMSNAETVRLRGRASVRPPFRKAMSAACMDVSTSVTSNGEATTSGHGARRAMLQQLHSFSIFSHDDHAAGPTWNGRESRDSPMSQSRSSSVCSIDKEGHEAVTAVAFSDGPGAPTMWVGTSSGCVVTLALSSAADSKAAPLASPALQLKGPILRLIFLEPGPNGVLTRPSPDSGTVARFLVASSEKQAQVVPLSTMTIAFKHNVTETSFVLHADVVMVAGSPCLAVFCANGHIMAFSLPSLRPLMDVSFFPAADLGAARTFCFADGGQALYLCSPTEIQRITCSHQMVERLQDLLGELFVPVQPPEAPVRGFFKGLFGVNNTSLDKEEMFGEAACGKPARSLAHHIPGTGGVEGVRCSAGSTAVEVARARASLDERGQRIGEAEERSEAMMASAENFAKHAHEIMLKSREKKWYQL